MKRKAVSILTAAVFTLLSAGCGVEEERPSEEGRDLRAEIDALASAEQRENNMDPYAAEGDVLLLAAEGGEGSEGIGGTFFLGSSRACFFRKNLPGAAGEDRTGIVYTTAEGESGRVQFETQGLIREVGPVVGTDHCLTLESEYLEDEGRLLYVLAETDETGRKIREIPLNFADEGDAGEKTAGLSGLAMDAAGAVHLVWCTSDGWRYQILSQEGEILAEYLPKEGDILGLVPLYDGRIAFWTGRTDEWGIWKAAGEKASMETVFGYLDAETGKVQELARFGKGIYLWTMQDEKTLVYADQKGIYRRALSGEEEKPLYLWANHGIDIKDVYAMETEGAEKICAIYKDPEGCHQLCLKPSEGENGDICEITIAVSESSESYYVPMVVEFNKKYPSCHIRIKNNYDTEDVTALLTELTAGGGPVLVDTSLTGFEEQEELWQPLDEVMEQLGLSEELIPVTMEAGKIDGVQYGVVCDFILRTLMTADPSLEDWDYDTFIQCVEDRPALEAIYDVPSSGYGPYFFTTFLSHGVDDSFLWDAESGKTFFDSEKFRTALRQAEKYVEKEERVEPEKTMLEGKVLLNDIYIRSAEELAYYRIMYGERAHFIGYPTETGARSLIWTEGPLAVRKTASDREKLVAYAFLDLCLSYDGQVKMKKTISFDLSVRWDVLEKQIATIGEKFQGKGDVVFNDETRDTEQDWKTMQDLLDHAKPYGMLPPELRDILIEELEQYFSGALPEDMLIDHLESRVGLYLEERK